MNEEPYIKVHDIPGFEPTAGILEDLFSRAANHTVGLIRRDHENGPSPIGSSTFVAFRGMKGLLTCSHVAEVYEDLAEIGIIRYNRLTDNQTLSLSLNGSRTWKFKEATYNENSDDLAFTLLPHSEVEKLEAYFSFVNLDRLFERAGCGEPASTAHVDAILGLVEERSAAPTISTTSARTMVHATFSPGSVIAIEADIMKFEGQPQNAPFAPNSYGGTSGAGLWRMYFQQRDDAYNRIETRLIGVAFFQRGRQILCQSLNKVANFLVGYVNP